MLILTIHGLIITISLKGCTMEPKFEIIDHTADLGIRVSGKTLKELYESAGMALVHLLLRGKSHSSPNSITLEVTGADRCDLMVRWLSEILFLFEGERLVPDNIRIQSFKDYQIESEIQVIPFDPDIHEVINEIKAVTYHQIRVEKVKDHWEATIIFDL